MRMDHPCYALMLSKISNGAKHGAMCCRSVKLCLSLGIDVFFNYSFLTISDVPVDTDEHILTIVNVLRAPRSQVALRIESLPIQA